MIKSKIERERERQSDYKERDKKGADKWNNENDTHTPKHRKMSNYYEFCTNQLTSVVTQTIHHTTI